MPVQFNDLQVVTFESRRADEMVALIKRFGGRPISAPSLREVSLENHTEALAFGEQLLLGQIDVVILLTGVGTQLLAQSIATKHSQQAFVDAMSQVSTVARGPKPAAALRELGLSPTLTVPEPNTWQDVLEVLDAQAPVAGKQVAIQEYGIPNPELIKALQQRGAADVMSVPIYRWELPEDLEPLRTAIRKIIDQEIDIVLVTSATQVHHLFQLAETDGVADQLRTAMKRVCIGSVGPVASEAIQHHGLQEDYEPDSPRMVPLVREMARCGPSLLHKKRTANNHSVDTNHWRRVDMTWTSPTSSCAQSEPTNQDSVFIKACRREPTAYTPVWIMRQAGRYQRAYRKLRAKISMLELCKTPDMAAEVTLMAVDRLGVDAAIIFADILLPVETLGFNLEFAKGHGPVIHNPVQSRRDLDRLKRPDIASLSYVFDAIRITRRALRPDIALIGFAGAPFTVASYLIEGGKSSQYIKSKSMMVQDPTTWHQLMGLLVDVLVDYLNEQIAAGADAVQLFDSWVGTLCPDDYRQYVLPHVQQLISRVHSGTPVIHFATGNPALLPLLKEAGGDVIGLDWRCDLAEAWKLLGDDVAVMGNLDPVTLYASPEQIRSRVKSILDKAAGRPGHIFNLGHGVMPDMDGYHVAEMVNAVHELSAR